MGDNRIGMKAVRVIVMQMSDLWLIAHKVRGEPAFDIATRMECPLCAGHGHDLDGYCHECDGERFWWIIPTSGHRAYPVSCIPLNELEHFGSPIDSMPLPIMDTVPDHYPHNAEPKKPAIDISALIKKPTLPIRRRV